MHVRGYDARWHLPGSFCSGPVDLPATSPGLGYQVRPLCSPLVSEPAVHVAVPGAIACAGVGWGGPAMAFYLRPFHTSRNNPGLNVHGCHCCDYLVAVKTLFLSFKGYY